MLNINIIAVGKIKEDYLKNAITEYSKRLSKFCKLKILEIQESQALVEDKASIEKSKAYEGEAILSKIGKEYVIVLDINGKSLSSIDFSNMMSDIKIKGNSEISFIIGGSYGLSNDVLDRADFKFSFSKLTFPHQLFRVMLLEQIYRAFKIEFKEPYHK